MNSCIQTWNSRGTSELNVEMLRLSYTSVNQRHLVEYEFSKSEEIQGRTPINPVLGTLFKVIKK